MSTEFRVDLGMAAGGDPIPLSAEGESSSSPRWSPDGKYLGFLSARSKTKTQISSSGGETLGSFYAKNGDQTQLWTLFREGGEKDWNIPIINSEQLYFALKMLGVPTELVIYPDELHGIDAPSHTKDRYERYLVWFGRYLKGEQTAKTH